MKGSIVWKTLRNALGTLFLGFRLVCDLKLPVGQKTASEDPGAVSFNFIQCPMAHRLIGISYDQGFKVATTADFA